MKIKRLPEAADSDRETTVESLGEILPRLLARYGIVQDEASTMELSTCVEEDLELVA